MHALELYQTLFRRVDSVLIICRLAIFVFCLRPTSPYEGWRPGLASTGLRRAGDRFPIVLRSDGHQPTSTCRNHACGPSSTDPRTYGRLAKCTRRSRPYYCLTSCLCSNARPPTRTCLTRVFYSQTSFQRIESRLPMCKSRVRACGPLRSYPRILSRQSTLQGPSRVAGPPTSIPSTLLR
jgi:hypothetical protein